jgi:DNA-binding CsgD family transcriptional regulator
MIIDSPRHFENLKIKTIAYEALYKIAFNKKDYIAADNYFRSYKLFDDSLNNETNTSLLSVLELQMAYEKHRNNLELENKEVKLRLNKKNYYITILAGIVALLVLVIYFVYRLQKARAKVIQAENKRIEQELEFKKREMTTNVMSLMKKNEILTELSRSLLELEKTALKSETKNALNKIAQKIRKTRDEEISEEFNIRFKEVHSEFYTNLLQQYPDLTPSEQRLCALLRMNMSTKEISELIGNNPSSIDNARSKIRKKFGIPGDVNLISFLSNF